MRAALLIGNNFAVLVGAYELALRGHPVTLLTDGKPLGGHFAGMQIDGYGFDIGMVFLEKHETVGDDPDLRTYDPDLRNDWTRFGNTAGRWMDHQVDLRPVQTPTCLVQGRIVPDYLISNRLDAFAGAAAYVDPALTFVDERHASHKTTAAAFDGLSYAEAAKLNHGEVLHSIFIEPFVRKLLDVSSDSFLARYHRAAWVPLFYPETLAHAQRGELITLPEYKFWTTRNGFVGQLVQNVVDRLVAMRNVTLVTQSVHSLQHEGALWTAVDESGRAWCGEQLALGLTPDRGHTLLGTTPYPPATGTSVTLLFALVKADAIGQGHGCLMVVDEDYAAYRLCDQDALAALKPDWHRVVLEANPNRLAKQYPGQDFGSALQQELRSLMAIEGEGAVRVLKCVTAKNALVLPTGELVKNMAAACSTFAGVTSGATLTGNLLGFGVASLNDQIVQGLKIAEEFL